jgi:hypothetical protein
MHFLLKYSDNIFNDMSSIFVRIEHRRDGDAVVRLRLFSRWGRSQTSFLFAAESSKAHADSRFLFVLSDSLHFRWFGHFLVPLPHHHLSCLLIALSSKMAATASSNSTSPLTGCKVSLILKSEIRYEGILSTINYNESTIALTNGMLCVS